MTGMYNGAELFLLAAPGPEKSQLALPEASRSRSMAGASIATRGNIRCRLNNDFRLSVASNRLMVTMLFGRAQGTLLRAKPSTTNCGWSENKCTLTSPSMLAVRPVAWDASWVINQRQKL